MSELLTHRVEGNGSPVLFLNGGMMSISAWEPIVAPFRGRHRLVRCDFRGQLLSPGEPPRSVAGHAADVVALLDALDLERLDVVGASFGGEVALLLAAEHPERVRSLCAVTVADRATPPMREGSERLRAVCRSILDGGDRGALHDLLVREVFSEDHAREHRDELAARRAQMAALPDGWFRGLLGLVDCLETFDLVPHVGNIRCPTLVVIAGQDRIMPRERSLALADLIPGAEVATFEESGHALVAELSEPLAERCLAFIERAGR